MVRRGANERIHAALKREFDNERGSHPDTKAKLRAALTDDEMTYLRFVIANALWDATDLEVKSIRRTNARELATPTKETVYS